MADLGNPTLEISSPNRVFGEKSFGHKVVF